MTDRFVRRFSAWLSATAVIDFYSKASSASCVAVGTTSAVPSQTPDATEAAMRKTAKENVSNSQSYLYSCEADSVILFEVR